MKKYKLKKEDIIECTMTTFYEVDADSLSEAKSLILKGKGEQVGLMFTNSDIIDEGGLKYGKDG